MTLSIPSQKKFKIEPFKVANWKEKNQRQGLKNNTTYDASNAEHSWKKFQMPVSENSRKN